MRKLLVFLALLAGCPGKSAPVPPPVPALPGVAAPSSGSESAEGGAAVAPVGTGTPLASLTQLVPLDAVDPLTLPGDLMRTVEAAREKIPERLDAAQVDALGELESRFEREEAAQEGPKERARVLGAYYWERLRLFAKELPEEPPEEILSAFERGTARGD
jgi:hypothetical protein